MTPHMAKAPDDDRVQAAMYGPLVLAALLGAEGLTRGMTYREMGPGPGEAGMPMPEVAVPGVWFEQTEATQQYPAAVSKQGRGADRYAGAVEPDEDERYSVYLRSTSMV